MTTTVAARPPAKRTIREFLLGDEFKHQVSLALPRHLTPDRFIRTALTALTRNPKLAQCTPESFFQCLLDLSALGLEADGRRAHLIPFEDRKRGVVVCTLIVDYKGLAELVRRSGEVAALRADVVCENDVFDYEFGSNSFLRHRHARGNRGKVVEVYSFILLKNGRPDFDVMSIEEVAEVRAQSRAKDNGPWVTHFNEMAKKTVFRRHAKWLPLSAELREQIEKDDELTETERFAAAKPVLAEEDGGSSPFGDALAQAAEAGAGGEQAAGEAAP